MDERPRIDPTQHLGEILNHIDACMFAHLEMTRQLVRYVLKAPPPDGQTAEEALAQATGALVAAFDNYKAAKAQWVEQMVKEAERGSA